MLICITTSIAGQDTSYYDKVLDSDETRIKGILEYNDSLKLYFYKSYDKQGLLDFTHYSKSDKYKHYEGQYTSYDEQGNVKWYKNFLNNKLHGEIKSVWPNGNLKRIETYKEGERIEGECFDQEGKPLEYYEFQIKPEFPGGDEGLLREIYARLKYPKKARKNGTEGWVIVEFVIDKMGEIQNPKITNSPGEELSKATLKAFKKISKTKWTPAMVDGDPVDIQYTMPVRFKLQ